MEEVLIARDVGLALVVALLGGVLAARLGLPAVVGYLVAGIVIGPHTPGVQSDLQRIQQLAEIGVVLLMFGVGVEFSLSHLRGVGRIAAVGGIGQVVLTIALGFGIGLWLGWPQAWSIYFGCIIAISSTSVLLKLLMDRGELGSLHGRVMIGMALVQDLSTVLMMSLLPALATGGTAGETGQQVALALLRAGLFLGLMLLLGKRIFPPLLAWMSRHSTRELFLLTTVALSLSTAFLATSLFGLSLALGAFVAGLVVSESELHYRILGETLPIREIFSTLFFVSVGMLVDPLFIWQNLEVVLLVSAAIVFGKFLITALATWRFAYPRQTLLLAAAGVAQIGEFSFIIAQQGIHLGLLSEYVYGLTLSGALFSTLASPLMLRGAGTLAALLNRLRPVGSHAANQLPEVPHGLHDHVIICGYGRMAWHLVEALQELGHRCVVIEQDWTRVQQAREHGALVIYGDVTHRVVLAGAHLDTARVVAVTIDDPAVQRLVVQHIHGHAPQIPIIARAELVEDLQALENAGASDVVVPNFEAGLEMLRQTLLRLRVPAEAVQSYADAVHREHYATWQQRGDDTPLLQALHAAERGLHVDWHRVLEDSPYVGHSIGALAVRKQTGAIIVAVVRAGQIISNPEPATLLAAGDQLAVLGDAQHRQRFGEWLEQMPGQTIDDRR